MVRQTEEDLGQNLSRWRAVAAPPIFSDEDGFNPHGSNLVFVREDPGGTSVIRPAGSSAGPEDLCGRDNKPDKNAEEFGSFGYSSLGTCASLEDIPHYAQNPKYGFQKTLACKYFPKGLCKKGADCTYAHSQDEIKPRPILYRTELCHGFMKTGSCMYKNCKYAHSLAEIQPVKFDSTGSTNDTTVSAVPRPQPPKAFAKDQHFNLPTFGCPPPPDRPGEFPQSNGLPTFGLPVIPGNIMDDVGDGIMQDGRLTDAFFRMSV